jgi:stearoyl-CoA desaturase (delta-9 desaturase)
MSAITPPAEAPRAGAPPAESPPHAELAEMNAVHRWSNLAGVVLPMIGLVVAIVVGWDRWVDWSALAALAVMFALAGFGVTLGFHRLLTHRSFQTFKAVEYTFAALGSMSVQGPVMSWVADHRKHHAHTDREGDPHSPHGHGDGFKGAMTGLWYAHMGWLFDRAGQAEHERYARDLHEDRGMRTIHNTFLLWVLAGILLPAAIGFAIDHTWRGALMGALWGGAVRIVLQHHLTWSINSVCHFFGSRRFDIDDHSTNVFWLAPFTFGEAWHHNHHAFPRSAMHGLRRWEIDPTAYAIRVMRRLKLAWNVVEISPERQRQKEAQPA